MKFIRRFVWYIVGRLFIISSLLAVFSLTFYYFMNAADIYVVLKDGMAKRAQVIMYSDETKELEKYFLPAYIDRDDSLQLKIQNKSPYSWYKIRGIDHRLQITSLWTWPWDSSASVDFIERIPNIDGNVLSQYRQVVLSSGNENALYPPKWISGKYRATLVHENGRWLIKSISKIQNIN
ncbi:MAG: hypothetical protein SPL05_00995 [Eubacteriales bacterium]|nr:hypothetical protein [Eubacteriales bacterium]